MVIDNPAQDAHWDVNVYHNETTVGNVAGAGVESGDVLLARNTQFDCNKRATLADEFGAAITKDGFIEIRPRAARSTRRASYKMGQSEPIALVNARASSFSIGRRVTAATESEPPPSRPPPGPSSPSSPRFRQNRAAVSGSTAGRCRMDRSPSTRSQSSRRISRSTWCLW